MPRFHRTLILTLVLFLCAGVVFTQTPTRTHEGYSLISVTPLVVTAGGVFTVNFIYAITNDPASYYFSLWEIHFLGDIYKGWANFKGPGSQVVSVTKTLEIDYDTPPGQYQLKITSSPYNGEYWVESREVIFITVTVSPNRAPVAKAGLDQTVDQTDPDGAYVTLDGTGSSDPDGDPLTLTYDWSWSGGEVSGVEPMVLFPVGTTTVTLTVTDIKGASSSDDVIITVLSVNKPPVANAGPDQIVEQDRLSGARVTLNGSASHDPEGDAFSYSWSWSGGEASGVRPIEVFPLGYTLVTLRVTSEEEAYTTDTVEITVQDTTAPMFKLVPGNKTVEQVNSSGTPASEVDLEATAEDICDALVEITHDAPAIFPLGTTTVTFTATDDSGNSSTATMDVTVEDTTPPDVSVSVNPTTLWPANHKMVKIAITIEASDICDSELEIDVSVNHNQAPHDNKGVGDGNTDPDWHLDTDGTLWLRAERDGKDKTDRIYTIQVTAIDDSGNSGVDIAQVTVPHDQKKK